jgi:glycosyltransferase involved in cell wall biosynthesis
MISIITRCHNRLEYTIQVINAVRDHSLNLLYEHIIIDNASSDGTPEWFRWMQANTKCYPNLKYIRYNVNLGDWGGMVAGLKHISQLSKYVIQLDNDIIPCDGWLESMVYVLENTKYKIVMLKRANVEWKLKPLSPKQILLNSLEICKVERGVACFMASTEDFRMFGAKVKDPTKSKYEIRGFVHGQIAKILNKTCIEIDGLEQRKKYSPKNPEVWAKL